jgi:release factor glutamine methyltransferase
VSREPKEIGVVSGLSQTQTLLREAAAELAAAGVPSPLADARQLMAHLLGVAPGQLILVDAVEAGQVDDFSRLVARRASRVPLQHLTGTAHFRHVEVEVGPGVFVPRPETEVMTGWAVDRLRELVSAGRRPLMVELCAGSGVISKAVAAEVPGADIRALEVSEEATAYAERNLAGGAVELHTLDMAQAPVEWDDTVDLIIANPPYIPLEAYESVTPEVRDHDPMLALFSGPDGLDAMRVLAEVAARLLVDDGRVCAEHAEVQEHSAPEVFVRQGSFASVRDHRDLTGRPRFVTATRVPRGAER